MPEWILIMGIPSAITGILVWLIKKRMDKQEAAQIEREKNQEKLILMMMNSTRSNAVGIQAIARAIQRIPDAKCNGDMEAALATMAEYQAQEKEFIMEQGIKHIFKD